MQNRLFGRTKIPVSEIGHGTWTMGSMWGPQDDRSSVDALVRGLDLGITFIDTAWIYGEGHSEELIASAFKEAKRKVFVATKVPPKNMQWPARKEAEVTDVFPPEHVVEYTEKSLKNLGAETVDLQQLHVWQDHWLKNPLFLEAVEKLKKEGKIRYFGISINDHQPENAIEAVESGLIDSVQVIYNIFDQSPEDKLFPACLRNDVAVIARVPFDEGSLTGALKADTVFHPGDWRKNYFTPDRLKETITRVEEIRALLPEGMTLPQLALKFCLAHPAVSVVIPGMRKIAHVEEAALVSDGTPLSPTVLEKIKKQKWIRNFYRQYG